ncbi:hypothetical protein EJB05_00690, partial [Eragrostis curvula]
MEAPLHHSPLPTMPAPAPPQKQQDALLQQAAAVNTVTMAMGREQCPRCASRDTKFCYYNNYNTAQPRHFCRACRRYWTLGGSLRNVPVGGSTRKRPRPATRALTAAVASLAAATTATASPSSCGPFARFASPAAAPTPAAGPALNGGLLSSLLLGSAPLLEGRLGLDPAGGLGQPTGAVGDLAHHLGIGAGQLLWPIPTGLQGDRAEPTWKAGVGMFPPALWQEEELAAAAPPMDHAGGGLLLHQHQHHGAPPLLL